MIGLLAAFKEEVGGILSDVKGSVTARSGDARFIRGKHRGKDDIVIAVSGAGMYRAAEASEFMVKTFQPSLVISTGTCGGISTDLQTGHLVIPVSVQYLSLTQNDPLPYAPTVIDEELHNSLTLARSRCGILGVGGMMMTADRIVRTSDEKRSIMDIPKAVAVDMESVALASVAIEHGIPFGIVRAVTDRAWDNMVVDYEAMLKGKASPDPLDVAAYIIPRPWKWGAFFQDVKRVFHASAVLKTYFRAFLDQSAMYAGRGVGR